MKLRDVSLAPPAFTPAECVQCSHVAAGSRGFPGSAPPQPWCGISLLFLPVGPQLSLLSGLALGRDPAGHLQASIGLQGPRPSVLPRPELLAVRWGWREGTPPRFSAVLKVAYC